MLIAFLQILEGGYKMIRRVIKIDEDKCDGCGLCAQACHEGAIGIIDGKAKLLRDDYCDGLGDCLPVCPAGAIGFEEREAAAFDEAAVKAHMAKKAQEEAHQGCPGRKALSFEKPQVKPVETTDNRPESRLNQWPVQMKLVPVNAPYFHNANLLVAADCTAFSFGDFHNKFMKNRVTLIGCPKLDQGNYADKLTEILKNNDIRSVLVVRMEVPCCGGITAAVKTALKNSGKMIPWQIVTLSIDGKVLDE